MVMNTNILCHTVPSSPSPFQTHPHNLLTTNILTQIWTHTQTSDLQMDVDLKCAEKVTDSDVEECSHDSDEIASKVAAHSLI